MAKTNVPMRAAAVCFILVLACLRPSFPLDQSGSIRGRIVDDQGAPQAGVYMYLSSPAMIGVLNCISTDAGRYGFFLLPSGTYTLTVEKPGFKTATVGEILVTGASTALVDVRLEPTEIEEEPVSQKAESGLDRGTAANTAIADADLLSRLPVQRDFSKVLGFFPGVAFGGNRPGRHASVHGGAAAANLIVMDGVPVTDPVTGGSMPRINLDFIEQVTVETAAHPAERGPVEAGYVNIVHKSGGNSWDGGLSVLYTGDSLADALFSRAELQELGVAAPPSDRTHWDFSLSAGGPAIKDMAWYFSNLRLLHQRRSTPFAPWADPLATMHWDYSWDNADLSGLFKLSTRVNAQFAGFAEIGFSRISQPAYEPDVSWNRPKIATRDLDGETFLLARAGLSYSLNQMTHIDISGGLGAFNQPLLLNQTGVPLPQYFDLGTGYTWGSGPYNEVAANNRLMGSVTLTRFQERILGADHELKFGVAYETAAGRSSAWKWDNLIMFYSFRSPYAYGQAVSPGSGNTVGHGLIGFSVAPRDRGALDTRQDLTRLGFFLQDTLTVGGRVALSLGLRFDRSDARMGSIVKGPSGNAVSLQVGEELIEPLYDLNPFSQALLSRWDEIITWNNLSPRAGLSFDLLGTGRTLVKASFARYPEYLGLGYSRLLLPVAANRSHRFDWYDENGDGLVDADDTFGLLPEDYRIYAQEFYGKRVDPKLVAPTTDEWTLGFEQEIRKGFTLSFRYISKDQKNIVGNVAFDPETESAWYLPDGAHADWWVPFQTVIPATDEYPETPVTVYFPSSEAPELFDRIQNVPELRRSYRALEVSLRKRWSGGWQFSGSAVFGRATGTAGLAPGWSLGVASPVLSPNSFVNRPGTSRLDLDRPVAIRLMGTARLPWTVFLSLYFQASSGTPWARSVTVIPPESWTQLNGASRIPATVFLESPGARREKPWNTLDLGLDKEFTYNNRTVFAVSLDILNVLGSTYRDIDLNDGGLWSPNVEGAPDGERVVSETYKKSLSVWGTRVAQLRLRLRF